MDGAEASALISRAKGGDGQALCALLNERGCRLERYIDRQIPATCRGSVEAQDVLQVTYIEAFLRLAPFKGAEMPTLEAWLYRAAKHNLLDALRALGADKRPPPGRRMRSGPADDSHTTLLLTIAAPGTTPTRNATRNEVKEYVERALTCLPPLYREVVERYDLNGQPIGEVAKAMHKSPGAVHMIRARAHERLREILGGPAATLL